MSRRALLTEGLVLLAALLPGVDGWGARRGGRSRGDHGARAAPAPGSSGRPGRPASPPGLTLPAVVDLVCAALDAGLPPPAAVDAAFTAARRRWRPDDPACAPLVRALALAERTGASAAVLLRRAAADQRAARRRAAALSTARLGVRLVLPLGLLVLPAFALLGVAPVVLGLAQQLLRATSEAVRSHDVTDTPPHRCTTAPMHHLTDAPPH